MSCTVKFTAHFSTLSELKTGSANLPKLARNLKYYSIFSDIFQYFFKLLLQITVCNLLMQYIHHQWKRNSLVYFGFNKYTFHVTMSFSTFFVFINIFRVELYCNSILKMHILLFNQYVLIIYWNHALLEIYHWLNFKYLN